LDSPEREMSLLPSTVGVCCCSLLGLAAHSTHAHPVQGIEGLAQFQDYRRSQSIPRQRSQKNFFFSVSPLRDAVNCAVK
jgi:hypothetical protein